MGLSVDSVFSNRRDLSQMVVCLEDLGCSLLFLSPRSGFASGKERSVVQERVRRTLQCPVLDLSQTVLITVCGSTLKLIQIVITVNKCLLEHPIVYTVKVNLK